MMEQTVSSFVTEIQETHFSYDRVFDPMASTIILLLFQCVPLVPVLASPDTSPTHVSLLCLAVSQTPILSQRPGRSFIIDLFLL